MEKPKCHNQVWLVIFVLFSVCLVLLSVDNSYLTINGRHIGFTYLLTTFANYKPTEPPLKNISSGSDSDSCLGRYIYVHHDLPSRFNSDLLKNCRSLNKWIDMCPSMENSGLGPRVFENNHGRVLSKEGWFSTNQFTLEMIFHNRMKRYKCLTNDSSMASAIYVPFYAGLDVGRYLWDDDDNNNTRVRDSSGFDIAKWLVEKPEWKRMMGRDHFFVAGRIAWDFRRYDGADDVWGSNLMFLPEFMNMTMLPIESTSWSNEFAIPYPTYFHPRTRDQVSEWQNRMRLRRRTHLFSFVGAPRPTIKESIRGEIIRQCLASESACKFLDCSDPHHNCEDPVEVMKVLEDSVFCLQPPGDSYTRRSIFDSILAGCIPVFFHPGSAYAQYTWYFPKNYTKYSLFIPGDSVKSGGVNISRTLHGVSEEEISGMREEVIRLIPKIVYGDARAGVEEKVEEEDALAIAVRGVVERVENVRRRIEEGKDPSVGFAQENSWESRLAGTGREQEFDRFFKKKTK